MLKGFCEWSSGLCLKKPLLLFSDNPVGGGIPHGVFPEMGPRGNTGPLTEHRPRWTGAHDTVQLSPDTKQTCIKAQTDTEARKGAGAGAGAASSGLAKPAPAESQKKGCKTGGSCCTPDLAEDSESVSDSVSGPLTDVAAHVDPAQGQVTGALTEPETRQARKSSVGANQESARPGKQSAGEHWAQTGNLSMPVSSSSSPPSPRLQSDLKQH